MVNGLQVMTSRLIDARKTVLIASRSSRASRWTRSPAW